MSERRFNWTPALAVAAVLLAGVPLFSQFGEDQNEPNGTASPYHYIHLVHSSSAADAGASEDLRVHDPFLFYEIGRELVNKQFTPNHGVVPHPGEMNIPLYVSSPVNPAGHGADIRFARDHAISCGFCHATPAREPGAGQNVASTSSAGRNTPHFFGAGLVEMIGAQIREDILSRYDTNRNGLIDREEAARPSPVFILPAGGSPPILYGDLQPGENGIPQLNTLFRIWYLDASHRVLPDAKSMRDARVAAFDFAVQVFGWGRGEHRFPDGTIVSEGGEATTLREIFTLAADVHMGIQSNDPSQQGTAEGGVPGLGGKARVSLNGAQQFDFGTATLRGPEHEAYALGGLTEGDLDAAEFYMLNAPAPAVRGAVTGAGRSLLRQIGCTSCHVENWHLKAHDAGYAGDRRTFRLDVSSRTAADDRPELAATLVPQWQPGPRGSFTPARDAAEVQGIYTDFKHWDIGPAFYERRYDGSLQRVHRTAPLWGVGSTAPYGHSGTFATLEQAIRAHAGAASQQALAFRSLSEGQRNDLLAYLKSLVLYPTDGIPADINGDGAFQDDYVLDGVQVGFERFDARFLFVHQPHYRRLWWTKDPEGRRYPLAIIENVQDAYQLNLPFRRDANGNGIPDAAEQEGVAAR